MPRLVFPLSIREVSVMRVFLAFVVLSVAGSVSQAESPAGMLVHDDFTEGKHPTRQAARGDWKIDSGVASVTQDDALYKKYKNHGPIMIYTVAHDDAAAEVTFKPSGCKAVVFTMDAKEGGHAFRVKLSPKMPGAALTYIKEPGKEKATPVFLNKELPTLKDDEWTTLKVRVVGDRATVTVNNTMFDVRHEQIDQEKKIAKLGFSFGSLSIKQFDLNEIPAKN
ncbi:MAG: hypothetical protein HKN47_04175 [Pirellulaceae bacterium]|nr:hypothetical protein [Pirellulaceae bacterium]